MSLTQQQVAKLAGVSQMAVSKAQRAGLLDTAPDGRIDPDGPRSRAWIESHKLRRGLLAPARASADAQRHLEAELERTLARIKTVKAKTRRLEQRLVPRDEAEREVVETIRAVYRVLEEELKSGVPNRDPEWLRDVSSAIQDDLGTEEELITEARRAIFGAPFDSKWKK